MGEFWGACLGVVGGSIITLLGLWFTNNQAEQKLEKTKKEEILKELTQTASLYFELLGLMYSADNLASYHLAFSFFGNPKDEMLYKDLSKNWIGEITKANRDVIRTKVDFQGLYTAFNIHFGEDEELKKLINDFLQRPQIILKPFDGANTTDQINQINKENTLLITTVLKNDIAPSKDKLMKFLSGKVSLIK